MWEPKIIMFRRVYSTDAELVFRSWQAYILSYIQDWELDNKSAIQLIKDQTLDNACQEVEFQLDLCNGVIQYQDLLRHLSVIFQGGDDEANLLAKFYSHGQKAKESEEVFADKLQILAMKVISKKPDFWVNLDSTLKQRHTSQLYDHKSTLIAKTLLIHMPKISFTEFRNELATVLGTWQQAISKVLSKAVSTSSIEVKDHGEEMQSKSKAKQSKKISMQSSQIKDLWGKLDQAIAKNSQIQEFLTPVTLQMAFTNVLHACSYSAQRASHSSTNVSSGHGKPFWVRVGCHNAQQAETARPTIVSPAGIVRILGTRSGIVSGLKPDKISWLVKQQIKQGVKVKAPASQGQRCRRGALVDPSSIISIPSKFDDMLKMLSSNAMSKETKQHVIKRAVSQCPSVSIELMGLKVPSLLDLGSMVTLVHEGYFTRNILPLLKGLVADMTEAHLLFWLSATNN